MEAEWKSIVSAAQKTMAAAAGQSLEWLAADQLNLRQRLKMDPLDLSGVRTIAGVDVQYTGTCARAAAVTLNRNSLEPREVAMFEGVAQESYEHGFLAYRELPAVLGALARLAEAPDVIIYDGNGTLHPRGFGAACHLGVLLDRPVMGVSKNVAAYRPFAERARGEARVVDGGALLVTRDDVNPVCVSPGHRCDLDTALALVLETSRVRVPEPTRRADQHARHTRINSQ